MLTPKKIKHRKWTKTLGNPRFSDVASLLPSDTGKPTFSRPLSSFCHFQGKTL